MDSASIARSVRWRSVLGAFLALGLVVAVSLLAPAENRTLWIFVSLGVGLLVVPAFVWSGRRQAAPAPSVPELNDTSPISRGHVDSRDIVRRILEMIPEAAVVIDDHGRAERWNPRAERLLEWTVSDFSSRPLADAFISDSRATYQNAMERCRGNGAESSEVERFEVTARRKNGQEFPLELTMIPVQSRSRVRYSLTMRDLSDGKRLEAQFRQAQKMEAIGRLAGGVAHDFNNILTAVLGYADLVQRGLEPGSRLEPYTAEVLKAGKRAVSLTSQLLAFSRKQVLAPVVLDLNAVVRDVEKMLHRLIGEDVILNTHLASGSAWIRADKGQVEQVLMNLAVNARDAMPSGGNLTIRTEKVRLEEDDPRRDPDGEAGPHVRLSVEDTGHGMDEETLSRLFEPFFTTKEQGKGTGLGLSTVYGMVKQSGGHIRVQSEVGKGTRFDVFLAEVEEPTDARRITSVRHKPAPGTETVMVVEDSESVRKLAIEVLRESGYRVLQAGHGEEAIRVADGFAGRIDLLLTDVIMPRMSGPELAMTLSETRPETRILFMSGYTDESTLAIQMPGPETAFLKKPFIPQELTRRVRTLLDTPADEEPVETSVR